MFFLHYTYSVITLYGNLENAKLHYMGNFWAPIYQAIRNNRPPLRGRRLFINFSRIQEKKGDGYLAQYFSPIFFATVIFLTIFSKIKGDGYLAQNPLNFFACGAKLSHYPSKIHILTSNFSSAAQKCYIFQMFSTLFRCDGYLNAAVIFGKNNGYFFKILRLKKKNATVIFDQKSSKKCLQRLYKGGGYF